MSANDQPQQPYRSVGYLAEIHPEQVAQLEEQLDQLPSDNPVNVAVRILIGLELGVDLRYCTRCGALVFDDLAHGAWHDRNQR